MKIKKSNLIKLIENLIVEAKMVGVKKLIMSTSTGYYFYKGGYGLGEELWWGERGDPDSGFVRYLNFFLKKREKEGLFKFESRTIKKILEGEEESNDDIKLMSWNEIKNIKVFHNGCSRSLLESTYPTSKDRAAGSKHGVGLAYDVDWQFDGSEGMTLHEKNKYLAENKNFWEACRDFCKVYSKDITWGGDYEDYDRAVLEFHHFEVKDASMPKYFEPIKSKLSDINVKTSQLTSESALLKLYKLFINKDGTLKGAKNIAKK